MRNDFGTRPYKSRFPYKAGTKKAGSKKQGYIDKKDESIGMRLGKGKATKEDPKKAKAERDMSYGKWGRRSKDWKKA
jgi:hypothetical protein